LNSCHIEANLYQTALNLYLHSANSNRQPNGRVSQLNFNYMGFGFGANINSFTSNASSLAPKAQTKIAVLVFPPIKDMPLSISVGIGITTYRQR